MKNTIRTIIKFVKASPLESAVLAVLVIAVSYLALPMNADATADLGSPEKAVSLEIAAMQNETVDYGVLPLADLRGPSYTVTVQMSAYTSRVQETDDSPFITASGTHVRFGVVASNMFPIGTRIKIPTLYGDQVFVVEDRMNKRYYKNVDIWMDDLAVAKKFGRKNVTIEVYPNK
jgi:3D (Asp-Asp-Asp) domain-containing protein